MKKPESSKKIPPKYDGANKCEPSTPYVLALQKYSEARASDIIAKHNWQKISVLLGFISMMSIGMNTHQSQQVKNIPVIVRTDASTGAIIGSPQKVTEINEPNANEVKYFLWKVITSVRTIPLDPVVYRTNWDSAYKFLSPTAAKKMVNLANAEGQKKLLEEKYATTVELKTYSELPEQPNTYQVRWQETYYTPAGKVESVVMMSGLFVLAFEEVTDALVNPFGIEIKDFNYSREG